jgi:hypothetical protein
VVSSKSGAAQISVGGAEFHNGLGALRPNQDTKKLRAFGTDVDQHLISARFDFLYGTALYEHRLPFCTGIVFGEDSFNLGVQ